MEILTNGWILERRLNFMKQSRWSHLSRCYVCKHFCLLIVHVGFPDTAEMQSRLAAQTKFAFFDVCENLAQISPSQSSRRDTLVAIFIAKLRLLSAQRWPFEVSRAHNTHAARYLRVRRSCKTNRRKRILLSVFTHSATLTEHIHSF